MTIRGKQRPPLASQSIAKAFWVILAHTYAQTQRNTHRKQEDTPQGHINHTHTHTHTHTYTEKEGRTSFISSFCCYHPPSLLPFFLPPNFSPPDLLILLILLLLFTFFHSHSLSHTLSHTTCVSQG